MQAKALLGLEERLMNGANPAAMELLESCWETAGRPEEAEKLLVVLKRVLDCCVREGIVYPRIFLRRKGELARGEFKPRTELRSIPDLPAVNCEVGKLNAPMSREAAADYIARFTRRAVITE